MKIILETMEKKYALNALRDSSVNTIEIKICIYLSKSKKKKDFKEYLIKIVFFTLVLFYIDH